MKEIRRRTRVVGSFLDGNSALMLVAAKLEMDLIDEEQVEETPKSLLEEINKESLFTFYDFPAVHWIHIRSTNPIESTFATVRHRTRGTKGCGTRLATLIMVFKLAKEAEKTWKKIKGIR